MKLISTEITTRIETKHEQPILTDAHKFESSVLHRSYNRPYFENEFGDICFSSFNVSYERPVYFATKYYKNLIGGEKKRANILKD